MNDSYTGVDNLEVMQEAKNYNRYLLNTIGAFRPPSARTLDFGAGSGQFAVPLSQGGAEVVALEPDNTLREIIGRQGVHAVSALQEIPDRSLGYVYSLNVLEHIDDDVAALRGLHAKLAQEGILLVYVPAFPILYSSMDSKVGHVRRYTRDTLESAVTRAGFSVRHVAYVDSLGFFATLLFKAFGSRDGGMNVRALKLYDSLAFPVSRVIDMVTSRWFGKNLLLVARKQ